MNRMGTSSAGSGVDESDMRNRLSKTHNNMNACRGEAVQYVEKTDKKLLTEET